MNINVLDNPVWSALSEVHSNLAIDYGSVKCYLPDYCPFAGHVDHNQTSFAIHQYSINIDKFFIVGQKPKYSCDVQLVFELVCNQMVLDTRIETNSDERIIQISEHAKDEVVQLVNLVMPGYFREKTVDMGSYFGIQQDGKIVALAGERMKMNDYTEVSAIVTHPNYVGKGYATKLISSVTDKIFDENKIPFLHVAENNKLAIHLYEKLGFKTRRKMSFWNIVRSK